MNDIQFSNANVRIRTYENKLLQQSTYDRLISLSEPEEIYGVLQDTVYADFIAESDEVHDFEQILLAEKKRTYENVYALTPIRSLVDLAALKYDYQNLKLLIKENYTQSDFSAFLQPIGSVELSVLKQLVRLRRSDRVDPLMEQCIEEVFQYIEDYREVQAIDIIFDNYYWDHLVRISQSENDERMEEAVKRQIDVFNISTTLRSYLMGQPTGFMSAVLQEGGTLSIQRLLTEIGHSLEDFFAYLEQTSYRSLLEGVYSEIKEKKTLTQLNIRQDNFMMERLKEEKITPFGPQAIVGFLFAKEIELKNLRMILIGKINKIPDEILQSRVRESYV